MFAWVCVYNVMLTCVRVYNVMFACVRVYNVMFACVRVYKLMYACVRVYNVMCASVLVSNVMFACVFAAVVFSPSASRYLTFPEICAPCLGARFWRGTFIFTRKTRPSGDGLQRVFSPQYSFPRAPVVI